MKILSTSRSSSSVSRISSSASRPSSSTRPSSVSATALRLLGDLLEHEVVVAALLGGGHVPVDVVVPDLGRAAVEVGDRDLVRPQLDDLVLAQLDRLAGVLMNAATSLARKFSPSPRPTTSGELRRAPTTTSGSPACTATSVNAPSSRRQTWRMASASDGLRRAGARISGIAPICSASRWATTSVSVSEVSSWPAASSSARSAAKFSMIPLWTTRQVTAAVEVRVGVAVGGRAVGGPPGVPDADGAGQRRALGQRLLQVAELAGPLRDQASLPPSRTATPAES